MFSPNAEGALNMFLLQAFKALSSRGSDLLHFISIEQKIVLIFGTS